MQQERVVLRLMIICMTLIAFMWITRGSLCELRIKLGDTEVAAILASGFIPKIIGVASRRRVKESR